MRNTLYITLTLFMVYTANTYTSQIYPQSLMNVGYFVMWIVGMVLIKFFTTDPVENSNVDVRPANKKCPHCTEEVMFEAKKCKHCGEQI